MSSVILAQDGESPLSYKSLALQMSSFNVNGDASSAATTSVSSFNGIGSYLDNPASMALSDGSLYTIAWLNQSNDQKNRYLGNSNSSEFSNTRFSNFGLVYKVPTDQGSLVLGGGYNLISKDNNETYLEGVNQNNSITDLFKQSGNTYEDIAFDAYAVDFRNEISDEIESIFRVDGRPVGFRGISQFGNITNNKTIGESSIFIATEIQKNLYVGASLGFISGSINYDRDFQEVDENNFYADGVVPEDGNNPATDIYSITLTDNLDTEFYAFSVRGGLVYKILPSLNIGASVVLPTRMIVTENYYTNIDTELDDFTSFLGNDVLTEFEYAVTRPAEFKVGATIENFSNLSFSAAAEYIDYSTTKVDLTFNAGDIGLNDISLLNQDAEATNQAIAGDFVAVVNFRSNATYTLESGLKLIAGYSYFPGRHKIFQFDETVYSAGLSIPLLKNTFFDISGQYSSRNDRSIIYEFENSSNQSINNSVEGTVNRMNIIAGGTFMF